MGDRTWLRVEHFHKDAQAVEDTIGFKPYSYAQEKAPADTPPHEVVESDYEEVNYGGWDECEQLAAKGVTFLATHGSGVNYSRCEMVGLRGIFVGVEVSHKGNHCVDIQIDDDGNIQINDFAINEIIKYEKFARFARAELRGNQLTPEEIAEVAAIKMGQPDAFAKKYVCSISEVLLEKDK